MRGYLTFNIFDHIEVNSWADSPECFPFLHARNAMPAPGWFQPQEKCLNRQQLADFPLFPPGYQKKSEKKIKMKFLIGFAWLITFFEGGIDKTESETQRSWISLQIYLGQIWTPELIRLRGHAALFTHGFLANLLPPLMSSYLPSPQTFLEFTLILWISISQNPFSPLIQNISSKLVHFLFPSGFIQTTTHVQQKQTAPQVCYSPPQLLLPHPDFCLQLDFFKILLRLEHPSKIQELSVCGFQMVTKPRKLHWAKGYSWPDRSNSLSFFMTKRTNPTNLPLPHTCNQMNRFCS